MARRFQNYQPSTALSQAITRYRAALAEGKHPADSGRAQPEAEAARDTPGNGDAEGGAARQTGNEVNGSHD